MPRVHTCKACHRTAVGYGYCQHHQHLRPPPRSREDTAVWRSRRGRSVREKYLAEHPYCFDCQVLMGRCVPATQVHHVQSQADAPQRVLDVSNMVALCDDCHGTRHGKAAVGGAKS